MSIWEVMRVQCEADCLLHALCVCSVGPSGGGEGRAGFEATDPRPSASELSTKQRSRAESGTEHCRSHPRLDTLSHAYSLGIPLPAPQLTPASWDVHDHPVPPWACALRLLTFIRCKTHLQQKIPLCRILGHVQESSPTLSSPLHRMTCRSSQCLPGPKGQSQ